MAERDESSELQRRLERLSTALGRSAPAPGPKSAQTTRNLARNVGGGGMALGIGLAAAAIATGQLALLLPAVLLVLLSGALLLRGVGDAGSDRAHIGLGATVADDAIIEPGAVVEMGATVGPGAHVKKGAVVRMGATVKAHAVLEEGAVVGWGADILAGAVLGPGAIVGAGATVHKGARVPARTRLLPGTDWAGAGRVGPPPAKATDPRLARIQSACERIDAELRQAPESIRGFLGTTAETASSLREVCVGLLEREKALRVETSAEALAFLDQEERELQERIQTATDERVAASFQSAVEAIRQQKEQRAALRTSADRLDAELTRLQWTLDGMATQLVRLRAAGVETGGAPTSEALQTVQQLHDEIGAITEALEHTADGRLRTR